MQHGPKPLQVIDGQKRLEVRKLGGPPGPPISLLADGLMHPTDTTVIYGKGDAGKSWVCLHIVRWLLRQGHAPLILDFESHAREWADRANWLGIAPDYIDVGEPLTRNLSVEIASVVADGGYTHTIVDSISMGKQSAKDSDSGGGDAAVTFMRNVKRLGVPSICIAHEPKHGGGGPIGSVQFFNQARLVLHVTKDGGIVTVTRERASDQPESDWSMQFGWVPIPTPGGTDFQRLAVKVSASRVVVTESLRDACLRVLTKANRAMSPSDIQHFLHTLEDRQASVASINATLSKLVSQGVIHKPERGKYAIPLPADELPNLT